MIEVTEIIRGPSSQHGEGPTWDRKRKCLFWVDMYGMAIHCLDPRSAEVETAKFGMQVCAVATPTDANRLLVAFEKKLAWVDWPTREIQIIATVEPNLPTNRCNDGKCDPAGRFWIGTMSRDGAKANAGALYRLDPDGRLTQILDSLTISNGMDWSPDGSLMYFIDSATREIWAFDFDLTRSTISRRRTVVCVPLHLGLPDGMTVDKSGMLWVAHWGAGCVCRWDPTNGELLRTIRTGAPNTSSCVFGGVNETDLYITTSQLGLDSATLSETPRSGCLLRLSGI